MLSRNSENTYNRLFLDVVQRNHAKGRFFCIWLTRLTPHERNIIEWGLEGYTQKEIAERLGLKPATLRKQHERIIKKLKKLRNEKKE